MQDRFKRNIDYLRVSLTGNCNLRCLYCMPENSCMIKQDTLNYAEFSRLIKLICSTGISKIRFTGGEPLLYPKLEMVIAQVRQLKSVNKIELTTNGILLANKLEQLKEAGLTGVNISLDCMHKDLFARLTRGGDISKVFEAINKAKELNVSVKINSVILEGFNETEIIPLALFAQEHKIVLRFIELMPMGEACAYKGVSELKIKQKLERFFGKIVSLPKHNSPAHYYKVADFKLGFISALSHKFCANCNRLRLTSMGMLKPCLFCASGTDLKKMLRANRSDEEILAAIRQAIYHKPKQHHFEDMNFKDKEYKLMALIGG